MILNLSKKCTSVFLSHCSTSTRSSGSPLNLTRKSEAAIAAPALSRTLSHLELKVSILISALMLGRIKTVYAPSSRVSMYLASSSSLGSSEAAKAS